MRMNYQVRVRLMLRRNCFGVVGPRRKWKERRLSLRTLDRRFEPLTSVTRTLLPLQAPAHAVDQSA